MMDAIDGKFIVGTNLYAFGLCCQSKISIVYEHNCKLGKGKNSLILIENYLQDS